MANTSIRSVGNSRLRIDFGASFMRHSISTQGGSGVHLGCLGGGCTRLGSTSSLFQVEAVGRGEVAFEENPSPKQGETCHELFRIQKIRIHQTEKQHPHVEFRDGLVCRGIGKFWIDQIVGNFSQFRFKPL